MTQSLTDKGMIRGVPRTNPPAPPPFTYNPRAGRTTPPESTSPVSPVTNSIPGAGPIARNPPPTNARPEPARASTMLPTPPEMNVVPTQIHESDESDNDEFDFGSMNDMIMPEPSPEQLFPGSAPLTMDPMMMMGSIDSADMGVDLNAFDQPAIFPTTEVPEEIISPAVARGALPLSRFTYSNICVTVEATASFGNQYVNDFGPTAVSPAVVFGPMAPYVQASEWANYNAGYQQPDYANNTWSNGYAYTNANDMVPPSPYQEQPVQQFTPAVLRTPTVGLDQDRLRNMLILYYFKHVRQMQYVFAGDVTTNVMMQHAQLDPQGVVSLALCSLAALHDSRMRIANGIMPNDQRARGPADKYYQKALARLQDNKQRTGRLTDADATAALHFVSFWSVCSHVYERYLTF